MDQRRHPVLHRVFTLNYRHMLNGWMSIWSPLELDPSCFFFLSLSLFSTLFTLKNKSQLNCCLFIFVEKNNHTDNPCGEKRSYTCITRRENSTDRLPDTQAHVYTGERLNTSGGSKIEHPRLRITLHTRSIRTIIEREKQRPCSWRVSFSLEEWNITIWLD